MIPAKGIGDAVLQATKGAFRFATGRIKKLKLTRPSSSPPPSPISACRGIEFWGGPIDDKYGGLLLEGEVTVSNRASSVTLYARPGKATNIASPLEAPGAPSDLEAEGRPRLETG